MKNKYITKLLYILQSFEYDSLKFYKYSFKLKIHSNKFKYKDKIKYTQKIKVLLTITLLLELVTFIYFVILFANFKIFNLISIIILLIILILIYEVLTPIYIIYSLSLIRPIENILKEKQIIKARKKVESIKNIKIITITGSYGKTSTTNFIKTLLSFDYKVFTPGKSINTILGISNEIEKNMKNDTEILVLEVGAYKIGEIKEVLQNFPSDISIITSIGTQHLEKFKSITNIIKAGTEIVDYSKEKSTIIAPIEIYEYPFEKYGVKIEFSKKKEYLKIKYNIVKIEKGIIYFKTNFSKETFHTTLLGYSMISNLSLAIKCAEIFNIKNIQGKINIIKPVKRRMEPIYINNVLYIDDTYNIGDESARSAITFLKDMKDKQIFKRIFVVTGGIVERGDESEKVNKEYGIFLSKNVDKVFIFNTPFKKYIKDGINKTETMTDIENYTEFEKYKKDFKVGDCILMQNEITDEYYFKSM